VSRSPDENDCASGTPDSESGPVGFGAGFAQGLEEQFPIMIVEEDVFPTIPTAHDVVNGSWVLEFPGLEGHPGSQRLTCQY
jgi:hypothetical protein